MAAAMSARRFATAVSARATAASARSMAAATSARALAKATSARALAAVIAASASQRTFVVASSAAVARALAAASSARACAAPSSEDESERGCSPDSGLPLPVGELLNPNGGLLPGASTSAANAFMRRDAAAFRDGTSTARGERHARASAPPARGRWAAACLGRAAAVGHSAPPEITRPDAAARGGEAAGTRQLHSIVLEHETVSILLSRRQRRTPAAFTARHRRPRRPARRPQLAARAGLRRGASHPGGCASIARRLANQLDPADPTKQQPACV